MRSADRTKAIQAADTLNDFVGDFVSGVMLLREYDGHYRAGRIKLPLMVTVQKICLSHLILSLCKFAEFYDRFKGVIPSEHQSTCRSLVRTITQKGVVEFRNKCVGHIWDKDQGRPLLNSEIMDRLDRMTDQNVDTFMKWLNDPKANVYPSTVVSVVETVRDSLMTKYSLSPDEIINR